MDDATPIDSTEFRCAQCGYDVSGSVVGGTCPECGKPVGDSLREFAKGDKSSGSATAAMVLGILSLTACPMLGPIAIFAATSAKKDMAVGGYSGGSHTMGPRLD